MASLKKLRKKVAYAVKKAPLAKPILKAVAKAPLAKPILSAAGVAPSSKAAPVQQQTTSKSAPQAGQSTIGKPLTGGNVVSTGSRPSKSRTLSGRIARRFKFGKPAAVRRAAQIKDAETAKIEEQRKLSGTQAADVAGSSVGGTAQDPALLAAQEEAKRKKALLAQRTTDNTPRTVLG